MRISTVLRTSQSKIGMTECDVERPLRHQCAAQVAVAADADLWQGTRTRRQIKYGKSCYDRGNTP